MINENNRDTLLRVFGPAKGSDLDGIHQVKHNGDEVNLKAERGYKRNKKETAKI